MSVNPHLCLTKGKFSQPDVASLGTLHTSVTLWYVCLFKHDHDFARKHSATLKLLHEYYSTLSSPLLLRPGTYLFIWTTLSARQEQLSTLPSQRCLWVRNCIVPSVTEYYQVGFFAWQPCEK